LETAIELVLLAAQTDKRADIEAATAAVKSVLRGQRLL